MNTLLIPRDFYTIPQDLMDRAVFTSNIKVELIKADFDDKWVCFAARTSTKGDESDEKVVAGLINSMMANGHGSPFEHMNITFRVTAPIMVWREHHRHRISSYNEESGRFKKLEPAFYEIPKDRPLVQKGKAIDYEYHPGTQEQLDMVLTMDRFSDLLAYHFYEQKLEAGIMKEVARKSLPISIMSTCVVTMNARALMNFLSLRVRDDEAARPSKPQWEIEQVAKEYEKHFKKLAPLTHAAYIKARRVAP